MFVLQRKKLRTKDLDFNIKSVISNSVIVFRLLHKNKLLMTIIIKDKYNGQMRALIQRGY